MIKSVLALSDTHCNSLSEILEGYEADILLHAGDWLCYGNTREWYKILTDLELVRDKFKYVVCTAGNHDHYVEDNISLAKKEMADIGVTLLIDEMVEVDGLRIYGSPRTPRYGNWAFMHERGEEIERFWRMIPDNLDILMTHGPPHKILDQNPAGEFCGDWSLGFMTRKLNKPPKHFIFGHIHSGYGSIAFDVTTYYNVAICNENNMPWNKPTVIEL